MTFITITGKKSLALNKIIGNNVIAIIPRKEVTQAKKKKKKIMFSQISTFHFPDQNLIQYLKKFF